MTTPTDPDVQAIAGEAYVFGYPLLLMDLTRQVQTNTVDPDPDHGLAPTNQFCNYEHLATPEDRTVVRANLDTLYSQAWLDLGPEPLVLSVPSMGDRYWLMQILDDWTNTVHDPSSVRPEGSLTYVLTGPDWSAQDTPLPDGLTHLPMPADTAWIIGRIEVRSDSDLADVQALQKQLELLPLSAWQHGHYVPAAGTVTDVDMVTPPAEQIAALSGRDFLDRLCTLLAGTPERPEDAPVLAEFATIGIVPGGNVDALSDADLDAAKQTGLSRIQGHTGTDPVNGWRFETTDIGRYGVHYEQRAYIAMTALGANLPQDALYPSTGVSADQRDGHRAYTLTFPAGQTPPVDAFWSLTAYDADGYLIDNAAQIYSIGHRSTPAPAPGSQDIVLLIQTDAPDSPLSATNWLPIPADGAFSLTMRLYAPQDSAVSGTWQPPSLLPAD
ncbi:DUF1254 domain-containing protein [Streptomyces sp. NPDC094032]|uniref:DUF1254 domain-containing protein n=1 Tax=Streptomyces sp. NPDC094032 TaxID=3155308 RepID=UPI00331AE947